jgi:hypothetical protein
LIAYRKFARPAAGRGVVFGPACVIRQFVDSGVLKTIAGEIRAGGAS